VPVYIVAAMMVTVALFFGVPLLFLILIQMKNLLLGKTTYERFSRSQQSILTRESSLLMNEQDQPHRPSLSNCLVMCCDYDKNKVEGEHASSTTTSFVRER
jgi:hypothetical protein